jgi:hypothetical protein
VGWVAVLVLGVIVFKAFSSSPPPALTTSCTQAALALSTSSQKQHDTVRWSATGPAGITFELTIGVKRIDIGTGGKFLFVPDSGPGQGREQRVSVQTTMPGSCKTSGAFGVQVPPGSYTVRMFRLSGPVTAPTVTEAGSAPLTVTADH